MEGCCFPTCSTPGHRYVHDPRELTPVQFPCRTHTPRPPSQAPDLHTLQLYFGACTSGPGLSDPSPCSLLNPLPPQPPVPSSRWFPCPLLRPTRSRPERPPLSRPHPPWQGILLAVPGLDAESGLAAQLQTPLPGLWMVPLTPSVSSHPSQIKSSPALNLSVVPHFTQRNGFGVPSKPLLGLASLSASAYPCPPCCSLRPLAAPRTHHRLPAVPWSLDHASLAPHGAHLATQLPQLLYPAPLVLFFLIIVCRHPVLFILSLATVSPKLG